MLQNKVSIPLVLAAITFFGLHALEEGPIKGQTFYVERNKKTGYAGLLKNIRPLKSSSVCPPPITPAPIINILPNPDAFPGAFFPKPSVSNFQNPPPQSLGVTFTASNQGINPETQGTPPDTYGVKGLTQFVLGDNQGVVSFDAQGNRDGFLDAEDESLVNMDGDFSLFLGNFDARIHYDYSCNRFVLVFFTGDIETGFYGNTGFTLAVSDSGIISDKTIWTVFTVYDSTTIPDSNGCPGDINAGGVLFDYPCLGIDEHAIYVANRVFLNIDGDPSNSLFVIPKKTLYNSDGPVLVTAFRDITNLNGTLVTEIPRSVTVFPLDNLDKNPTYGYAICQATGFFGKLQLFRIVNPGSNCPSLAGPFSINVLQTYVDADPNSNAPFPTLLYGDLGRIETLDDRLADSSHILKKQIYSAHGILTDANGIAAARPQGDRRSVRWYQIDVTGDPTGRGRCKEKASTIPALVQAGTLYDTSPTNPLFYFFPAIISNDQGDIVIAGTVSGNNQPLSAFFVGKAGSEPKDGTLHIGTTPPNVYAVGSGHFTRALGSNFPGQRWGDMSFGNLDPVDRKTIWTIQEIAVNGLETGVVAQLLAP